MEIKKNCREFTLIALGILVMITPFVIFGPISVWAEVILGIAVVIVGAWPLISRLSARIPPTASRVLDVIGIDFQSGPKKEKGIV